MNPSTALAPIIAKWKPSARSDLLPALIEAQEELGWLSQETLTQIAQGLRVPLADAYGVADFYAHLYTHPVGKKFIRVCDDVICALAGSETICAALEARLKLRAGETTPDGEYTLEKVSCLGHCDHAPVVMTQHTIQENARADAINQLLITNHDLPEPPNVTGPLLLKNLTDPNLHTLAGYLAHDGFSALKKTLTQMTPTQIVDEVKASGLIGRGGAAFPTGMKWELGAKAITNYKLSNDKTESTPRGYLICNADESETGTFKDRVIIERNPFVIVEAMVIAARAIGATHGYIYLRGEYPLAYERMSTALETARAKNYLGEKILGTDFSFDIELRLGAGAYVCGEETALFESIEGKRGEPRAKPPFPTDNGLFGKPTVINNVETLANVPFIVTNGAIAYKKFGTDRSPGTRVVCVSGQVNRAGVYEIEMGMPLRKLIDEVAGGLRKGRKLQAVLIGGAAGVFLKPNEIDVALDFQSLASIGATFGSGAIMVFDDTANMWGVLKRLAQFFKDESCGKCFPCQLGTQRQLEIIERIARDGAKDRDSQLLHELGQVMRDASLCGLGQTAASAILSALDKNLATESHGSTRKKKLAQKKKPVTKRAVNKSRQTKKRKR